MSPPDVRAELTDLLHQVVTALGTDNELAGDLDGLTRLAVRSIAGASGASIAMLVDDTVSTISASDHFAFEVDLVQYNTEEGPCLVALSGSTVRVAWLETDDRFPHFALGAADQRVQSVLSTPVIFLGRTIGTLNLYGREREAFDGAAETNALVIAAGAAVIIERSRLFAEASEIRSLAQQTHEDAAQVSTAQGVLMELAACSAEEALNLLRHASDMSGDRILDAARRVLAAVPQQQP